jgi:hypothetical protein
MPNAVVVASRVALAGLVVLGLLSVGFRLMFPDDAATRLEPLRQWILGGTGPTPDRVADVAAFDAQFRTHRFITLVHIVPGALFLLFVPLQLSRTVRSRFVAFHRWNGRALLVTGAVSAGAGLYFGIATPFAGLAESIIIVALAGWFGVALTRAYRAIRRRDIEGHREWMLRALAVPIGVTVVRLTGALVDIALTPAGYSARVVFVVALYVGWAASLAVTEWWVRRSRPLRAT